jgi:iron(III) transport system substrate-binding protein
MKLASFLKGGVVAVVGLLSVGLGGCAEDGEARETFADAPASELRIYTATDPNELPEFERSFRASNPDIRIVWVRESTGMLTAKLLREGDRTAADIVWGLAATSLGLLAEEGFFQPYAPAGVERLYPKLVDVGHTPPLWIGQRAWVGAICFNTAVADELGLPRPSSWKDLTKPIYKGHIAMPNPNSSGTGYLHVSAWLQLFGESHGWAYMDGLHRNIAWYTHAGSKPCRQAGAGKIPIGLSFAYRGAREKSKGLPIDVILPDEGIGWDMEAFAIIRGTKNATKAQSFADWSVSQSANEIYNRAYAVVALHGVARYIDNYPSDVMQKMIQNDFAWAASSRLRILKEWEKRYDSKSEPRS